MALNLVAQKKVKDGPGQYIKIGAYDCWCPISFLRV